MRQAAILSVVLVVGVVIGLGLAVFVPELRTWRGFADDHTFRVLEMSVLAARLRSGEQEKVLEEFESKIPYYLKTIQENKEFRESANGQEALWHLKNYYSLSGLTPSAEVRAMLDKIPDEHPQACPLPVNERK